MKVLHFESETPWLHWRKQKITGSDAPVIAGCGYTDLYSRWCEKTGKIPGTGDSLRFAVGHALEPVIHQELSQRRQINLMDLGHYSVVEAEDGWRGATPDRLIVHSQMYVEHELECLEGVAEFKTLIEFQKHTWDEGPPPYVWIQLQHQLSVLEQDWGIAAALIGLTGWADYDVHLDPLTAEALQEAEYKFWKLVESDYPPPIGGLSSKAAVAQMYPQSQEMTLTVDYSEAWHAKLEGYRELKELHAEHKKDIKIIENELAMVENGIKSVMGDADRIQIGDTAFTWKESTRKGFTVADKTSRKFKEAKK